MDLTTGAPPMSLLPAAEASSLPPLAFHANATRYGQLLANGVPFSFKGVRWPGTEGLG